MMLLLLPIIVNLLTTLVESAQNPSSPCPHIFNYETRNTNELDRWYGILSIQTNEELNGIWIHVILDRSALQLGNWFGNTTNVDNREFIIVHPKYRLEVGPPITIRFFVIYNPDYPQPSVRNIRLNGKTICGIEEAVTSTTPTLHLSEIRLNLNDNNNNDNNRNNYNNGNRNNDYYDNRNNDKRGQNQNKIPPGQNKRPAHSFSNNGNKKNDNQPIIDPIITSTTTPIRVTTTTRTRTTTTNGLSFEEPNSNDNGFDFFPGDFSVNRPSINRPITSITSSLQQQQQQIECGRVAIQPSPLISYGQNTTKGQFPWHAALYHSRGAQLMYTCGGTLISDKHILTAAHCTAKPQTNNPINSNDILVYLGKYNLKKFGPEVQDIDVSDIYIHPKYNYSNLFNDIAILKLSRNVQINDYVRPCCLWDDDNNHHNIELDNVIGQVGIVVGWGFNEERELSNDLMQTEMPIVSTVKCIYSNREFFSRFTFEKNFCAGFKNGTSVCNGDSGGGLILPKSNDGHNKIWQIRGIVSVGVALQGYGVCDPQHYAVFTDVAKHLDWIRDTMRK